MRLNEAGLDGYFDSVVTYDDTGKREPAKEPFFSSSASSST
jgi:FMN phosphatase YigB (HAD superfamily)